MQKNSLGNLTTRLLATSALVALIAGAPATVNFDPDSGMIAIQPSLALAKDGDSSGSGSGGDGGGGGDSSGSGSGGDGGDGGDSSGSGSDGDGGGDSDNSGSGSNGSDDGDDDNDNSGSSSDDDGDDDDNSGSGSSGDDGDDDDDNSGRGSRSVSDASGAKVEISGNNIEVTYPDGAKEEIENGVYERKDATGETVEERPATQTDRNSLAAAAAALGNSTSVEREFTRPDGTKVEVTGNNIEVEFANGWKEEIEAGRFEMKDPNGNTVVERAATDADRARLEAQIPG